MPTNNERLAALEEKMKEIKPILVFFDRGRWLGRAVVYSCGIIVGIFALLASITSVLQWIGIGIHGRMP